MDARDPFRRRTATPGLLAPWLLELARNAPGLLASYLPGGALTSRTRERIILAVTEVNGCRYCAWIHGAWQDLLGAVDPPDAEEALLTYARACAEAGRPLDIAPLATVLPPEALGAVRATVAQIEVANLVGNTADGLIARVTRKRPLDPIAAALEVATLAVALPIAVPMLLTGATMRAVNRAAPPMPEIEVPEAGEANLLAHLLAQTVPAYLANALVRAAVLGLPAALSIGLRAGRTTATITIGKGAVKVANGITADALFVVEGDVEPLLKMASGAIVRELGSIRLRPS
jgi:AhpD family alkylhydroperoxidase